MSKKHFNVVIVGAGGIGSAVGLMLVELADFDCSLFIGDQSLEKANQAVEWIKNGVSKKVKAQAFQIDPVKNNEDLVEVVKNSDILLDCLPGSQAFRMGKLAYEKKIHYVNLTEHVEATNKLRTIIKDTKKAYVLQAGLAPGFINILAHQLFKEFCITHKVDRVEYIGMKVGALSSRSQAPYFYNFTWSTAGVATEYVKDAVVAENYKRTFVPSLSENEIIVIDGVTYECNYTSGGAADLPEALQGKVKNLNYKTLRYPGHFKWINDTLLKIHAKRDIILHLQNYMEETIPFVQDDMVVIHAIVKGFDNLGRLFQIEKSFKIYPVKVGKIMLRAIQSTTAASMAECARMVLLNNTYKGVVLQSMIDENKFMSGPFIKEVYFKK